MIEIVNISQRSKWDNIVNTFKNADVYYLRGYVKAFQLHGDGEPILLHYVNGEYHAICVMMRRDISRDKLFMNLHLPAHDLYDLITPYGYGGFIFNTSDIPTHVIKQFHDEFYEYLKKEKYVSAFFRFHPLMQNADIHAPLVAVTNLGKTIAMDLTSPELIWQNIISKNRNVIRKAEKLGVSIKFGKGIELLKKFKQIYDETMLNDNANKYYYFGEEFYESICSDLTDNYVVFYAEYDGDIISMAIILYEGKNMHYHLSGSKFEYRSFAPSNLMLYKAALWGWEHGFELFHLGGGIGSGEDNLYKFKAAFNRKSDYQFAIGKMIINTDIYNNLMVYRGFKTSDEESEIKFFPQYRATIE